MATATTFETAHKTATLHLIRLMKEKGTYHVGDTSVNEETKIEYRYDMWKVERATDVPYLEKIYRQAAKENGANEIARNFRSGAFCFHLDFGVMKGQRTGMALMSELIK